MHVIEDIQFTVYFWLCLSVFGICVCLLEMVSRSANGAKGASPVSDVEISIISLRKTLAAQKQTIEDLIQEKAVLKFDLVEEIKALTAENKALKKENGGGATKNKIATLKHNITVFASELSRTKDELCQTEYELVQTQDEKGHLKAALANAKAIIEIYEAKMGPLGINPVANVFIPAGASCTASASRDAIPFSWGDT